MPKLRIGIIGAGASGMTATKACLEEGFDVVVFERFDFTGDLWRYHEEDIDGIASVMKSTIINSSKELILTIGIKLLLHFNYQQK